MVSVFLSQAVETEFYEVLVLGHEQTSTERQTQTVALALESAGGKDI